MMSQWVRAPSVQARQFEFKNGMPILVLYIHKYRDIVTEIKAEY